ncbi:phosphoribosylglycinamide formyltransferase [Apiospora arundinis]
MPGKIVRVTVNRKGAKAIKRAEKTGISTNYFNLISNGFYALGEKDALRIKEARSKYDSALAQRILQDKPEPVVMAGWMHIFSEAFLRPLKAVGISVINLHRSARRVSLYHSTGRYDGAGATQRAFEDIKASKLENNTTGLVIHGAVEEVDRGDAILQQAIEVKGPDTLEDLSE